METKDVLISLCGDFMLEYRPNGNMITVTKITRDGCKYKTDVKPELGGDKLRKLCGMLWAARATPATAKELAEDIEV